MTMHSNRKIILFGKALVRLSFISIDNGLAVNPGGQLQRGPGGSLGVPRVVGHPIPSRGPEFQPHHLQQITSPIDAGFSILLVA